MFLVQTINTICMSTAPALSDYIPLAPVNAEAKKHNRNLPGMGGIFNTVNMHLYHYAGNNPVKYTDPDGRMPQVAIGFGLAAALQKIGVALAAIPEPVTTIIGIAIVVAAVGITAYNISEANTANQQANQAKENLQEKAQAAAPAPASPNNDGDDEKGEYESNPKHHQNSKNPEPKNAQDMFNKSVKDP